MKEKEITMDKHCNKESVHSKITRVGKLLFISHELPLDPETGQLVRDDFTKAVKVCMENLRADLEAEGTRADNIVSTTVYVKKQDQINLLEEFFTSFFGSHPPAKKIVEGEVEDNVPILIDAVAIVR